MDRVDVVVVGGGIAGLIAAAQVSRRGSKVRLLEAIRYQGGRARTQLREGFHFNQGPHALYVDGRLNRALRELGVEVSGAGPTLRDALAIRAAGGERHALPLHPEAIQRSTLLDDGDRSELVATLGMIVANATSTVGGRYETSVRGFGPISAPQSRPSRDW